MIRTLMPLAYSTASWDSSVCSAPVCLSLPNATQIHPEKLAQFLSFSRNLNAKSPLNFIYFWAFNRDDFPSSNLHFIYSKHRMEDHVTVCLDQKKFLAIHTLALMSKKEYCAVHFSSYTSSNTETSCLLTVLKGWQTSTGGSSWFVCAFSTMWEVKPDRKNPKPFQGQTLNNSIKGQRKKRHIPAITFPLPNFGLEIALKLMRALWLLSKKRIWIMLFSTQMFAGKVFQVIFGFL